MKKATSTLMALFLCLYVSAQVGVLDPGFNNLGTPGYVTTSVDAGDDYGQAIATHADGRVVVALYTAEQYFTLLRYLPDGTPDPAFGTGGMVMLRQATNNEGVAYAITVLSDNKILVAGSSYGAKKNFALLKLEEDGTPDITFGTNGWVITSIGSYFDEARAIAVQSDGKIVVAGTTELFANNSRIYDFAVARYSASGVLETGMGAFGSGTGIVTTHINASDKALSVLIQKDGKILVGGTSNSDATDENFAVVRYNSDGSLDAAPGSFGTGGIAEIDLANGGAGSTDEGYTLALQADGKILMVGMSIAVATAHNDVATIRLTTNGTLDATFNSTGAIVRRAGSFTAPGIAIINNNSVSNTDEGTRTIAIQNDGKIIIGGDTDGFDASFAFLLARFNSDGTLDNTFDGSVNGNGVITYDFTAAREYGFAVALYNNRIYFAGSSGPNGSRNFLLSSIQNDGSPLPLVLSQFYAQKQTSKVVLQWQTTSEENVKQFVVERSSDGKTYKAIGTVAAAGNSSLVQKYSFADGTPFMAANNYYRLLMQDADGNSKYSKILIIKFDGKLTTEMKVNPSLVKDILQVQLPDGMKGNISLQIIDMNGRIIRRNNIASDGSALNTTLDVSSLVKGVYVIKATAANKTSTISRFTKQ